MVMSMKYRDLFVTSEGRWYVCKSVREWNLHYEPYRFHRFLTEVEDVLEQAIDQVDYLPQLRLLVRRLITSPDWLQTHLPEPTAKNRAILLCTEVGYPLTVEIATHAPGSVSSVHNHGNWAISAVLQGEEKNTFWRRITDPRYVDRIEPIAELTLLPGDIISFTPDAIHSIAVAGDEPTVIFNLYGATHSCKRFEFNPQTHTAKNF